MAASDNRAINSVCGTSHVNALHHLRENLDELFDGDRKYRKPNYFDWSGKSINDNVVQTIISKIDVLVPQPHVVTLVFGGNNISNGDQPEDIFRFFQRLVDHAKKVENVFLVICGLIPRPSTDQNTKELYDKTSRLLNNLCRENKAKCSFVNTSKMFCQNGEICLDFYAGKPGLKVHLNQAGALIFAKGIHQAIRNIPKNTFN